MNFICGQALQWLATWQKNSSFERPANATYWIFPEETPWKSGSTKNIPLELRLRGFYGEIALNIIAETARRSKTDIPVLMDARSIGTVRGFAPKPWWCYIRLWNRFGAAATLKTLAATVNTVKRSSVRTDASYFVSPPKKLVRKTFFEMVCWNKLPGHGVSY